PAPRRTPRPLYSRPPRAAGMLPTSTPARPTIARTWRALGNIYSGTNKFQQAHEFLTRALREFRALDPTGPSAPPVQTEIGATLLELGHLKARSDRPEEGRDTFNLAATVFRRLADSGQGTVETDTLLIKALSHTGLALNRLRQPDAAERELR